MPLTQRHLDRPGGARLGFTELGFGGAPIGNLYRAISDGEAASVLAEAWAGGLRHFDTAPLYGHGLSERRLGAFLQTRPRDSFLVSTKVGRLLEPLPRGARQKEGPFVDDATEHTVFDYSYDGVMRSFEASLQRLGLDRIDILYAHDLDSRAHGSEAALQERLHAFLAGGYRALLALRDQGAIRAFGAGVNEVEPCLWLAERGDIDLFLLAGRYTLLDQTAGERFLPLAQERGIGVVIGAPYNSGILATGAKPGAPFNYSAAPQPILDRVAQIHTICERYGVRMFEAAFQFPLRHPAVLSVIPGVQSVTEMKGNLIAAKAEMPAGLWSDLEAAGLLHGRPA